MIIVDNEAAYVGSANQSYTAMRGNREMGLVVRGGGLARALEAIFEAGWTGDENQPGFENGWSIQWIYPVATPVEVPSWVAKTEETVLNLINSARRTIRAPVYIFTGTPSSIPEKNENAARRGVGVQIIVDSDYKKDIPLTHLENPNTEIKVFDIPEYPALHSKVVVVDGEKAYVGSANWTSPSMISRREIGIAFKDPTLASALEEIFRADWESRYARWVKEPPSPLVQILVNTGIILAALTLIATAVMFWRHAKSKRGRRKWIAELWASSRHEV